MAAINDKGGTGGAGDFELLNPDFENECILLANADVDCHKPSQFDGVEEPRKGKKGKYLKDWE